MTVENVELCVCSRRRPIPLARLLDSVESLLIPDGQPIALSILVVENDVETRYSDLLDNRTGSIPLRHVLEPRAGLSSARNRLLAEARGDLLLIVDDDQKLSPGILRCFLRSRERNGSPILYGSNPPLFERPCPPSLSWFFEVAPEPEGAMLPWAPTNCLFLERGILSAIQQPWFDPAFNHSGGEDIEFTSRCVRAGFAIRSCPEAIAWECIPPGRMSLRYILARSRRDANVGVVLDLRLGTKSKHRQMLSAFKRLVGGAMLALPCLLLPGRFRYLGLHKFSQGLGMLDALAYRSSAFYARASHSPS